METGLRRLHRLTDSDSEVRHDPETKPGVSNLLDIFAAVTGESVAEGYARGNVLASYAHLHLASRPEALDRLVDQLERGRNEK